MNTSVTRSARRVSAAAALRALIRAPRIVAVMMLSIWALQVSAQPSGGAAAAHKLTVSGASTLSPLVRDIARRFERLYPAVSVDVRSIGSAKGMAALRAGSTDIAMLSRQLLKNERDLFSFPVARDGIAVVVHRDNPVKDIATAQLRSLVLGNMVNWKTLGGPDAPIRLAWRKGHGSFELMLEHLNLRHEQVGTHMITVPSAQAIEYVVNESNAVTLISVGIAERSVQNGAPIKLLAFDGVAASSRNIQNHGYGLSRPLVLVTDSLPQGIAKEFIEYALSAAVVDLQRKHGFVPYRR
jgi:phosphate transport system substrate-binding protein